MVEPHMYEDTIGFTLRCPNILLHLDWMTLQSHRDKCCSFKYVKGLLTNLRSSITYTASGGVN